MRLRDVEHVRDIVQRISAGGDAPTRSDFVALLILVRDAAPADSLVRDLGHNIAHDTRDRGRAFENLGGLVQRLRAALEQGPNPAFELIFPVENVMKELNVGLASFGISERLDVNSAAVRQRFAAGIADAVAATTYKFKGADAQLGIAPTGEYLVLITITDMPEKVSPETKFSVPWLTANRPGDSFRSKRS
jgi:hypothetical protein